MPTVLLSQSSNAHVPARGFYAVRDAVVFEYSRSSAVRKTAGSCIEKQLRKLIQAERLTTVALTLETANLKALLGAAEVVMSLYEGK